MWFWLFWCSAGVSKGSVIGAGYRQSRSSPCSLTGKISKVFFARFLRKNIRFLKRIVIGRLTPSSLLICWIPDEALAVRVYDEQACTPHRTATPRIGKSVACSAATLKQCVESWYPRELVESSERVVTYVLRRTVHITKNITFVSVSILHFRERAVTGVAVSSSVPAHLRVTVRSSDTMSSAT